MPAHNFPEPTLADALALADKFLPRFTGSTWWLDGVTEPETLKDGTIVLGYRAPSAALIDFEHDCVRAGFCYSFDWPAWGEEAGRLVNVPGEIEKASLADLRRLLTSFIRADRFGPGVMLDMAENGVLTRVLERLRVLGTAGSSTR